MTDEKALEAVARAICALAFKPDDLIDPADHAQFIKSEAVNYRAEARAAITAYLNAREEAGFVEVPREPTYEMANEGDNMMPQFGSHPDYAGLTGYDVAIEVYRAMLAKAK